LIKIEQVLNGATQLGKETKISPKTVTLLNQENFTIQFDEQSVMVKLSIGDHKAYLVMSQAAFDRLKDSEVKGETMNEFKKGFLK
jgi:hypothetical protein